MGTTNIEWTATINSDGTIRKGKTWNPVSGCTPISPGCEHCFAKRMAHRLAGRCGYPEGDGFAVTLHPEKLIEPLRWRKPERIFVCSMGDIWHKDVPDEFIGRLFGHMALCPHHTFLLLTKRPERMREWMADGEGETWYWRDRRLEKGLAPSLCEGFTRTAEKDYTDSAHREYAVEWIPGPTWPLPNVWLGFTAEDQPRFDERWPFVRDTPAAHRFVSIEPMLERVKLPPLSLNYEVIGYDHKANQEIIATSSSMKGFYHHNPPKHLDWVIAGAETGPKARPADLDWFRDLRDQCAASGTAFFLKQVNAKHEHLLDGVAYREIPA